MPASVRTIVLWVVLIIMGVVMFSLDKATPEQQKWLPLVPVILFAGILVMAFSERGAHPEAKLNGPRASSPSTSASADSSSGDSGPPSASS